METINTSLSISIDGQSLWKPGAEFTRIDTGNSLIFDPALISKSFGWDGGSFSPDVSLTAYADFRFGLLAWAELGNTGTWGATYDLDLTVDFTGAVLVGGDMVFDFSDYRIAQATIDSVGFSPKDGYGAGLNLLVDASVGVDVHVDAGFLGDYNHRWAWLDEHHDISLVEVRLANEEITFKKEGEPDDYFDDVLNGGSGLGAGGKPDYGGAILEALSITARLPAGANTSGAVQDSDDPAQHLAAQSGVIEGHGVSTTRFLEVNADLDELLTNILNELPIKNPKVKAAIKFLEYVVFADYNKDLGEVTDLVPTGKVKFSVKMVDISAGVGLVITEDTRLDITETNSDRLDIGIRLTSDNGTPYDGTPQSLLDDVVVEGMLGDTITVPLRLSNQGFTGLATVTADFDVNRAHFSHEVGLGVNASFEINMFAGSLGGSWVPSALRFSFGPLIEEEFPKGGWNASLGTLFSDDFEIDGSAFDVQVGAGAYEVFFVQPSVAPIGWDPSLPGAIGAIFDYFEALREQQAAGLAAFPAPPGFNAEPDSFPNATFHDYSSDSQPVYFLWTAGQDNTVLLNQANGSLAMVAPGAFLAPDGELTYRLPNVGNAYYGYSSPWQDKYWTAYQSGFANGLYYAYGNTAGHKTFFSDATTNAAGRDAGDALVFFKEGSFYDGKGNTGNRWDVFVANFAVSDPDTKIVWDLAKSVRDENDGDPATMGGVTLENGVTVRNVEAVALFTGNADDYLVGAVQSDAFVTGWGNDFVMLPYYVAGANGSGTSQVVDVVDDYVRLEGGDDTALVELGNIPSPMGYEFTDYIFGGAGMDSVFVRPGMQGLRYDARGLNGGSTYLFGGQGIGSDASHAAYATLLSAYTNAAVANYDEGANDAGFYPTSPYVLLNGGSQQGRIEIAGDVETVSVFIDEGSGDGTGDDLLVFMGGSRYDGGAAGHDTFVADFGAYGSPAFGGTRGGLLLDINDPVSYFGDTVIRHVDRLHVIGTSDTDVIRGADALVEVTEPDFLHPYGTRTVLYDGRADYIDGGDGDDLISGGADYVGDELRGGNGNDTFFWVKSGNDSVDGGAGVDTINVSHENVEGSYTGGGHQYIFYDANGTFLLQVNASSYAEDLLQAVAYTKDPTVVQVSAFGTTKVQYTNVEKVNITGSVFGDDLLIYQGGDYYIGGNQASDNHDTFVADFRGQEAGIDFRVENSDDPNNKEVGYWLANDVFIQGIDRGVVFAGDGFDILMGGRLNDVFLGGGGDDVLYGGDDNSPDTLNGGEGNDTFYFVTEGSDPNKRGGDDVIIGGENTGDRDRLMIAGGYGPTRVAILEFDEGLDDWVEVLPYDGANARGYAWAYYDETPADTHNYRTTIHSDRSTIQMLAENSLRPDLQWRYYNNDISETVYGGPSGTDEYLWRDPQKQGAPSGYLSYVQIESVDVAGSDEYDDIVVFQRGVAYVGGERPGDRDLFVGNFRGYSADLVLDVDAGSGVGYDIGQGTQIADFERFHLLMGAGDDVVKGGALDDVAYGGAGNDSLFDGLGDDYLAGEEGDDFFEHQGGTDEFDGGAGNDVLAIGASADPFELSMHDASGAQIGAVLSMVSGAPGIGAFSALYALAGDQYVVIEHGASALKFQGIEEVLMSGTEQNDVLIGGASQGILFGGGGNDALIGRAGNDFMSGGAGNDIYVFGANFGHDIIFGEGAGGARLMFTANAVAQLSYSLDGIDLVVAAGPDSVRIRDYFVADNTVGLDFVFETTDGTFTKDFSALGAVSPGAPTPGITYNGTDEGEFVFAGTDYADTIRTFGGDDFVVSSLGGDLIDGGAGLDSVSYFASGAAVSVDLGNFLGEGGDAQGDLLVSIENVAGSVYGDVLIGNSFGNLLAGFAGADSIEGRAGNDVLIGDDGNDTLDGGEGNDNVDGGDGDDVIRGGAGVDHLFGGAGADHLDGGDDADVFDDGDGDDTVSGGDGSDMFIYTGGLDHWDGGPGSDAADFDAFESAIAFDLTAEHEVSTRDGTDLTDASGPWRVVAELTAIEHARGTTHDDLMVGDAGDNQFEGNLGDDTLTGNAGADVLAGGGGFDTLDYSRETGPLGVSVWMDAPGEEYAVDTDGDTDLLSGIEAVIGTGRVDHITGNAANNVIRGGGGDDYYLDGAGGDDVIYGEGGNDLILGGDGADTLIGGAGDDDVEGEGGDDLLVGSDGLGNDTYDGGTGFDTVSYAGVSTGISVDLRLASGQASGAQIGTDTLVGIENIVGGAGNDLMVGNDADNGFSFFEGLDTFTGNGGSDTVSFREFHSAVRIDLTNPDEGRTRDADNLDSGTWRTIAQISGVENIVGSAHHDQLVGDAAANILDGGSGNDTLDGGLGNDWLIGGDGGDTLIGNTRSDESDTFEGGAGTDTLDYSTLSAALPGGLSLVDGDGNDTVREVERLVGSSFGDLIFGSAAPDIIQGGVGSDTIRAGYGDDLVVYIAGLDVVHGGAGSDTLDYSAFGAAVDVDLDARASVVTGDTPDWNVGAPRTITTMPDRDVENAIGSAYNDRLVGGDAGNMFNGGGGNDLILGMGGDDMFAYSGGLDRWDGGTGVDTANYSTYGYAVDVDLGVVNAAGFSEARSSGATTVTSGTLLTITEIANVENVIGSGFDDVLHGDAQANTIMGLAGDDTLDGGAGADLMDGGEGDDTYFVDDPDDLIHDSAGTDTVRSRSDYVLGEGLESLELIGSAALHGTGNALDNAILGNAFANTLVGGGGDDTLDGGAGADLMDGGEGDDTYIVDDPGDVIHDSAGVDTVRSARTYVLGDGLEALELTGGAAIDGTGNALANAIIGNGAGNVLEGGAGGDTLSGADGDDTIAGGSGNDVIDGGSGADIAVWDHAAGNYRLIFSGGQVIVADTAGTDGTDILTGIERLQFTDKTVIVESRDHGSYADVPEGLWHFFIVAFNAAPGVEYMDQLAEAHRYGLSVKEIVDIFTTKQQFTDVYPLSLSDDALAQELVAQIVKSSATDAAKAQAIADIKGALAQGWSRGDVIYTVFGNLASKPFDDATWGGTARQFANEIAVAKHYTEEFNQSTTNLQTLRDVLAPVNQDTDVGTPEMIASIVGVALME